MISQRLHFVYRKVAAQKVLSVFGLIWLLAGTSLKAQEPLDTQAILSNVKTLSLISKHYGDSIVLRWAPVSADIWFKNLHQSCLVERREVSPTPGEYQLISDSIRLMPELSLEQFAASHADHPLLVVLLNNAYRDWENSLYDGEIATMLEKASNFKNRWALSLFAADMDPVVADVAGLRFVDKNIKKGVTYAYKVYIPDTYMAADHKVVHPNIRKFCPMIYQGFERDSSLVIQWQKIMHDAHFTAYYIERSEDEKTFTRLNDVPYVQAFSNEPQLQSSFYTYTDRVANGKNYHYRIVGLDAFGDESKPSLPVTLKARDLEPPLKAIVETRVDSLKKGVIISWSHDDPRDVKNFMVWYSEGGGKAMAVSSFLAADERAFFHQPKDFNGMGKYVIACADADGNVSLSEESLIRVPDFYPPAAPTQLEAMTDSTGLIRVRWAEASENDILGYFVYAADGDKRHFQRLTPKLFPFRQYTDTVDIYSLTEMRYYTIVAVDDAMNYSAFSDTLEVSRPDVMPPSPAWIQSFDVSDSAVVLQLIPSSSKDVQYHTLMRKGTSDSLWTTWDTLAYLASDPVYIDTNVMPGNKYVYTLLAVDGHGLVSKKISEKHILIPWSRDPTQLDLAMEKDTSGIPVIRWKEVDALKGIQVYIKQNNTWTMIGEAKGEEMYYKLQTYHAEPIMAKAIFNDGSKSKSIVLNP